MRCAGVVLAITLLGAACTDDEASSRDLGGDAGLDLAFTSPCLNLGGLTTPACDEPPDTACSPQLASELLCYCTAPARVWFCCHPEIYQCPSKIQTGDFCCPGLFGSRICGPGGSCVCSQGQFICGEDGGAGRD
jgi:hypothetical protein